MTRLIDVDRLIFHSCNDMKGDCPYWGSANCGVCQKSLITRAEIDNAPTVDTDLSKYSDKLWKEAYERGKNERPHGEWRKKVDDVGFVSYICSECGFELELEDCSDSYYCTNCGAKMGEADNEVN